MRDDLQRTVAGKQRLRTERRLPRAQYRGQPQFNPPTCAFCGNRSIRPFSAIYGRGTTIYTKIKGFFLKHGYERTKRQSVLANRCSPPLRLPWSPAFLLCLLYFGIRWAADNLPHMYDTLGAVGYYLAWAALLWAVAAIVNNLGFYPQKIQVWGRSYYCDRCGSCTTLKA